MLELFSVSGFRIMQTLHQSYICTLQYLFCLFRGIFSIFCLPPCSHLRNVLPSLFVSEVFRQRKVTLQSEHKNKGRGAVIKIVAAYFIHLWLKTELLSKCTQDLNAWLKLGRWPSIKEVVLIWQDDTEKDDPERSVSELCKTRGGLRP